tara:strand:- start:502 stop:648 length:147 start_codon:yes stop_codon:yes gene_type:complete
MGSYVEWKERCVDWQEERIGDLQDYFDLSELQTIWISFLLGAFLIWVF